MNISGKKVFFHPLSIHIKSDEPDIIIFTSGRSGGTWLTELLSMSPGIRSISEPLSLSLVTHPRRHELMKYRPGKGFGFIEVPHEFHRYFSDILDGKLDPFPALKPIRKRFKSYHFFTNRTLLKICHGKGLIRWFLNQFNVQIIYLYRNPVPTILSMMKRGFNTKYQGFLNDPLFVDTYLNNDQIMLANRIIKHGSTLEKYMISWILENLIPLNEINSDLPCIHISHEELVIYPERSITLISDRLGLSNKKLLKNIKKPSSTTGKSVKEMYFGNKLLANWKNQISQDEFTQLFEILKKFGNDLYNNEQILPTYKYLNFHE